MARRRASSEPETPLLAGRYRHNGELARGATGRVIALLDRGDVPRVAKVLDAEVGAQAQWELDALLAAQSPHLASAVELLRATEPIAAPFSVPKGAWILVESRAGGEPSGAVLASIDDDARRGARMLAATVGVLRALGALHARGLSHGDVKPENVLLEGEHATLVDLGAAAPFGCGASLSGTLAYMAPEAREGERSIATDLWSLGATLIAWATGAPPGLEPHSLPAWVPGPLAEAARTMLAERSAERPRDTNEVLRALSFGTDPSARGPNVPTRPPLVGMEVAIERLIAVLDAHEWALVVGPTGCGRSRLVEEAARAIQRREARAGREAPTYLRTDRWPEALDASTFVHVDTAQAEGSLDRDGASERAGRLLAEGRIAGHGHRVVLEVDEAPDVDARRVVRVPSLELDEARLLLTTLLGEPPGVLVLRAAMDATGNLAGRLVRGVESLTSMGLDPRHAEDWRLVSTTPRGAHPTLAAQRVTSLAMLLGGAIELSAPPDDAGFAEGARWLVRQGRARLDASGALVLHREARAAPEAQLSAEAHTRALRDAGSLMLTGLSRAILDAHGEAHEASDQLALALARELRELGRPEETAERLSRYLGAIPTQQTAERAALRVSLADALRASGQARRAAEMLDTSGLVASFGPARLLRAELARLGGDPEGAIDLARTIEDDARLGPEARAISARALVGRDTALARSTALALLATSTPHASTRAHEVLALIALLDRRGREVVKHARGGLQLASRIEPRHARAAAEARLASLEAQGLDFEGHLEESRARHVQSAELARDAADRLLEATFEVNAGLAALEHGDLGPALTFLEHGARLLHRLGRRAELTRALTNLANAHGLVGDDARARTLLEEAAGALEGTGDADAGDLLAIVRSELLVHRGKLRAACAALEGTAGSSSPLQSIVRARLAAAYAASGDLERAEAALAPAAPSDDPRTDAERALADARIALAQRDLARARESLARAAAHASEERVGFELRARWLALEVELEEGAGRRPEARAALSRLRAVLEPALRSLPVELQSRFRQVPGYRRALAEGAAASGELGSLAQRALEGLATLVREPRSELLDDRLAEIALALATAERAFVVEWTETGLVVRGRAGTARADVRAMPSSAIALRALREHLVVSTDAVHEHDASSSVHALALRSVLAVELSPRITGCGPRVLVVDDPLRAGAFDAGVVGAVSALAEVAGPLLSGRAEVRRSRQRERRAERREAALMADARRVREEGDASVDPFLSFVHADPSTARLVDEARRLAASELPILLVGESGVGKDLLARAIHRASPRRHEPLVAERGGALAGTLADAALFGHVRGAFTGAEAARKGLFELADGGTLLLDGIEDIPLEAQAKLLRILVEGEVRPLGASRMRRVDVRLVATTRLPPHESIARGILREDFYYRVAGAVLSLAPLRERPRDLDVLVERFLSRSGRERTLSSRARDALHARRWPGNVRELEHALTEALLRASGSTLDVTALGLERAPTSAPARAGTGEAAHRPPTLHEQRGALTREMVLATLEAHHGNRTHAARALGISRFGLQKMLRRLSDAGRPSHDEK